MRFARNIRFIGACSTGLNSRSDQIFPQVTALQMSSTTSSSTPEYTPSKVWEWDRSAGGLNRPIAGPTKEKNLPVGRHPFQLYSMATPNGVKVTVLFEELLQKGIKEAEYDAWPIRIFDGDQFGSGFVDINPNSKIPALMDLTNPEQPVRLFESGSILLYLADRFEAFIPKDPAERAQVMNWLFWQVGSAPYLGGGFGHFYHYAPTKQEYPINRFAMETKRQLDVLDKHLEKNEYIAGEYSIADIAIWPWYGNLVLGNLYGAAEFLSVESYANVLRWARLIAERPAVKRGALVNKVWGEEFEQLPERHSADDFDSLVNQITEEKKEN